MLQLQQYYVNIRERKSKEEKVKRSGLGFTPQQKKEKTG